MTNLRIPICKAPPSGGGGEGLSYNPSPQHPVIKQVTPHGEVFLFSKTL